MSFAFLDVLRVQFRPSMHFPRPFELPVPRRRFERDVRVLSAVIVNLFSKMVTTLPGGRGKGAVRIVFRARAYPPGSRNHGDVRSFGWKCGWLI